MAETVAKELENGKVKEVKEPPDTPWEVGESDLEAAKAELAALSQPEETSAVDAFVATLEKWDLWENSRVSAEQDYALRNELRIERNLVARQYAEAKHRRNAIEKRLAELLRQMSSAEQETVLTKSFVLTMPNFIKVVQCKKELRERLQKALAASSLETGKPGG